MHHKNLIAPLLVTLLAAGTVAGAQAQRTTTAAPRTSTGAPQTAPQSRQPSAQPQRGDRPERGPLTVKYYAGDPLKGGKLLSSATIQPADRDAERPAQPFANAPRGATHVTIGTPFGTRVLTLKDAQAGAFDGRGGPDGHGRGDRTGAPDDSSAAPRSDANRPGDARSDRGPRGDRAGAPNDGLRLPGLQGASRVTFYAADPLAGGKAQTSIALNGALTAAQQQAVSQAASKAKFAVIERGGETTIVDLSAQPARR